MDVFRLSELHNSYIQPGVQIVSHAGTKGQIVGVQENLLTKELLISIKWETNYEITLPKASCYTYLLTDEQARQIRLAIRKHGRDLAIKSRQDDDDVGLRIFCGDGYDAYD
jgi:preprotein translocase subunit YajC